MVGSSTQQHSQVEGFVSVCAFLDSVKKFQNEFLIYSRYRGSEGEFLPYFEKGFSFDIWETREAPATTQTTYIPKVSSVFCLGLLQEMQQHLEDSLLSYNPRILVLEVSIEPIEPHFVVVSMINAQLSDQVLIEQQFTVAAEGEVAAVAQVQAQLWVCQHQRLDLLLISDVELDRGIRK